MKADFLVYVVISEKSSQTLELVLQSPWDGQDIDGQTDRQNAQRQRSQNCEWVSNLVTLLHEVKIYDNVSFFNFQA